MEIGGVPNIRWNKGREGVMKSEPSLRTSGYTMNLLYIPPDREYKLRGMEFIVCLLRGSIISKYHLPLRKSMLLKGDFLLKSGENGCLLFVCRDEGDNYKFFDDISGLEIKWSEYNRDLRMYRTIPQIYVDGYRINLWYLGYLDPKDIESAKHKAHTKIHNHSNEPIPFVEFHTQLRGDGWMVKYEDKEGKKELERIKMVRGYTHDLFCSIKDKKVIYPWHEYIAEKKGSLFIVFENTKI